MKSGLLILSLLFIAGASGVVGYSLAQLNAEKNFPKCAAAQEVLDLLTPDEAVFVDRVLETIQVCSGREYVEQIKKDMKLLPFQE